MAGKQEYIIPYFGIIPKIIDFGFSSISELKINNSINNDKYIRLYRSENDLAHLFSDIYNIDNRYYRLLHELDTNDTFIDYDLKKIPKNEKIDYLKMLNSGLFSDYVKNIKHKDDINIVDSFSS